MYVTFIHAGELEAAMKYTYIHTGELEAAMKYVFGKTIVCKDLPAAKACAFGEGIKARSVTLEGDLFDPAGKIN